MSNLSEEDDLTVALRSWKRDIHTVSKSGYREGVEDGSSSVFQESFDIGYEGGFKAAYILGKYKGYATILPKNIQFPQNIKLIINSTRRGGCYLCSLELENSNDNTQMLMQIMHKQKKHTKEIIDTLHTYFEPLLQKYGLNIIKENM